MATVPARAPLSNQRQRFFYITAGCLAALIVLIGFSRTYFLKPYFGTPALTPLVHLHGILFTGWVALFITQATLIAKRQRRIHMTLGIGGFLLAIAMVIVGTATAIASAKLPLRVGGPPPLIFLALPLSTMVVFSTLIGAGFYFRRRSDYHKRFMLIATLAILTAAFGRMVVMALGARNPLLAMGATELLVISVIACDTITNRRLHPAFAWAGGLVILMHPLQYAVARTDTWMTFARWLTS